MRPSSRGDARGHGVDGGLVGDVGDHGDRLGAAAFEFGDRGNRFCFVASDDRDRGARFRQSPGHAEPDAAIAAGDDRHLAAESRMSCFHGCCPCCCVDG